MSDAEGVDMQTEPADSTVSLSEEAPIAMYTTTMVLLVARWGVGGRCTAGGWDGVGVDVLLSADALLAAAAETL